MIFVIPQFPQKFLAFHSALAIDVYLPFAPLPAICIISLLPFFLPINFLMYRYASRVASIRLDLVLNVDFRILLVAHVDALHNIWVED
jgi:hypothetical protein